MAAATDDAAGLTDEAVAGLSEDQVRLLAAWSHAPATDAEAAERRVLESQEQPAPAMEGEEGGNGDERTSLRDSRTSGGGGGGGAGVLARAQEAARRGSDTSLEATRQARREHIMGPI